MYNSMVILFISISGLLKDIPNHQFYVSKAINTDDTAQVRKIAFLRTRGECINDVSKRNF